MHEIKISFFYKQNILTQAGFGKKTATASQDCSLSSMTSTQSNTPEYPFSCEFWFKLGNNHEKNLLHPDH
ncbi:hypothetical protein [Methylophilus sp. TWE2]|uniref:hypothetical protein n=1 Tax=Methylophilus sp. TWE2 TaxID=1662285 RepID=UPI000670DC19|nr:hypothetical protein [Methylophilus sp. TWE2]AKR43501.1 hypothetical protein ACJ67_08750 [Methylophilus sp. TWE2]